MGVTKSDLFTKDQNELSAAAKVFAHPARIAILQILLRSDSCINGDLVDELGLAQATISQHLRELKDSGIIKGTIEGTRVNYCINPERWEHLKQEFVQFFEEFKAPDLDEDCC